MSGFQVDFGGDAGAGALDFLSLAAQAEEDGFDGIGASETRHDPFITLAVAARETSRIELQSVIAVAFARSPMTIAQAGWDLQALSRGRFALGLGSQVQAHIEKRFSMPWSRPAARMAEFVRAVRAIWIAWETGERLAFRGEFYTHTLMTPFFTPEPMGVPTPPIWLAAVGPRMTEVVGEVADGLHVHPFTTARYLDEVSIPALRRGAEATGRDITGIGVALPALISLGEDRASLDAAIAATKKQIAFYGSTPAYLPVLALHGWEALHEQLNGAARRGEWDTMGELVPDEVLAEFAAVGSATEVAAQLRDRFDGRVTRISFSSNVPLERDALRALLAGLRAG